MTLEEQYITLMDAAGRVTDQWCRDKFIQEADNVLMHINAQVMKNRQELNAMSAYGSCRSSSELSPSPDGLLMACVDELVY